MEFVRTRRLEIARIELPEEEFTVGEAAYCAGYSSTANFSAAFQRKFGYPTSACIDNFQNQGSRLPRFQSDRSHPCPG